MESVSKVRLESIMGADATAIFLEEYGGLFIHIPMQATSERGQRFEQLVGKKAFTALRKEYGGSNVSLPMPEREAMKERIIPLLEKGMSYNAIAKEVGCHWRHVAMVKQDVMMTRKKRKNALRGLRTLPVEMAKE